MERPYDPASASSTLPDLAGADGAALCRLYRRPSRQADQHTAEPEPALGAIPMSITYQAVGWNRTKKIYDALLAAGLVLYLGIFVGIG